MKYFYKIVNDICVGIAFTISTLVSIKHFWIGLLYYVISYMILDLHPKIDEYIDDNFD